MSKLFSGGNREKYRESCVRGVGFEPGSIGTVDTDGSYSRCTATSGPAPNRDLAGKRDPQRRQKRGAW
jgi:hypothetical protein